MAFDGEAFVRQFGRVWNEHDVDGIIAMFTDDVVFEASFGEEPWGTRAVGKAAARELITDLIERVPDIRWDEVRHFVCPEHATVESVTTGSPRAGECFEVHLVDVLTLRDGKIAAMVERVPDIRWDEVRNFVCPEHATVESITTGTPRDGERFEVGLVDVLTLRDGKIAAKRSYRKGRL